MLFSMRTLTFSYQNGAAPNSCVFWLFFLFFLESSKELVSQPDWFLPGPSTIWDTFFQFESFLSSWLSKSTWRSSNCGVLLNRLLRLYFSVSIPVRLNATIAYLFPSRTQRWTYAAAHVASILILAESQGEVRFCKGKQYDTDWSQSDFWYFAACWRCPICYDTFW